MDAGTIYNTIQGVLDVNIFKYAITGGKALAFVILGIRMLDAWSSNIELKDKGDIIPSIEAVVKVFGGIFIIFAASFIMETIEDIFSSVNVDLMKADEFSSPYLNLLINANHNIDLVFAGCEHWYQYIGACFEFLFLIIGNGVTVFVVCFIYIADFVITLGYLVQRYFIYLFLQFLFPLAVAFSTFPKMENLFWGWVKRYIGVFVLGIGYIGVIYACNLIGSVILQLSPDTAYTQAAGALKSLFSCVYVVLLLGIKKKLFENTTSFVWGYFN